MVLFKLALGSKPSLSETTGLGVVLQCVPAVLSVHPATLIFCTLTVMACALLLQADQKQTGEFMENAWKYLKCMTISFANVFVGIAVNIISSYLLVQSA